MKSINWKLILQLSSFGLAMAIVTVSWVSSNNEPLIWFIIFPICAYLIAKKTGEKYFLHGLFLGLINCIWITAVHIIFADTYLRNHPQEAAMMINGSYSPQILMLMTGPIVGVASGIVFGLFAIVLARVLRKAELNKQRREQTNNQ
jgi:hypothetical protein